MYFALLASRTGIPPIIGVAMLFWFLIMVTGYFLPTIIGYGRHKTNAGSIFALNLFLGWTLVCWVLALVWALAKDQPPPYGYAPPPYYPPQPPPCATPPQPTPARDVPTFREIK